MSTRTQQAIDQTRRHAIALAAAVRTWAAADVHTVLEEADRTALAVVLAAMVPEGHSPRALLAWTEDDPHAPVELHPHRDIDALAGRAMVLAAAVRAWDYTKVSAALGPAPDWDGLCVVLAAMVPDDQPVDELLAWTRLKGDALDRGRVLVA